MITDPLILLPSAFVAGILMFLAPCTLPIIPGYLLFIGGVPLDASHDSKRRIFLNAAAFVLGFSFVFVLLGLFAGTLGSFVAPYKAFFGHLIGGMFILFGLVLLDPFAIPFISREWHPKLPKFLALGRWQSSLILGVFFALGWSPCVGPILGSVLLVASRADTALQGAFLLAVFSAGLGTPFLLTAYMIDRAQRSIERWGKYAAAVARVVGALLVLVGVLVLFNMMAAAVEWVYQFLGWLGYNKIYHYF